MWDNITCWKPAHVGEMVLVSCPELFQILNPDQGGFPAEACSGHTQGSPGLSRDKHQGHGAPSAGRESLLRSSPAGGA